MSSGKLIKSTGLWFLLVVALLTISVFWDPLFSGLYLWGPDSGAFGYVMLKSNLPGAFLGQWGDNGLGNPAGPLAFSPYHLLVFFIPALSCHVWTYIAAVLTTTAAGLYFLRGLGVKGWQAYAASMALGFSAYTFSLISAGHMGKFEMMSFAVLMFAALHRAISRRSIFYYGLAGVSAGYGFICQADIMFLFALLAGTYAIFLFVRYRPGASKQVQEEKGSNPRELGSAPRNDRRQGWLGFLLINAGGVIVAAVFFLAISSMSLQNVIKTILPSRASIAKVAGTPQTKEENKWEFATNWSLPPEEILEFFAPGVFGLQTGDVRGPYWGRMGRTPGWEQHHQGLMNLRQHTVYLGVIQIVFAIYTVVWAVRRRGRNLKLETRNSNSEKLMVNGPDFAEASKVQGSKATGENSQAEDREKIRNRRADIFFWTGTFITAILLALGRYFPLYRLFYMLPYVSSMRCPAKFLHLVEFALCILFAFGLEAFSRDTKMVNAVAVKNGTQVEKRKAGKRS